MRNTFNIVMRIVSTLVGLLMVAMGCLPTGVLTLVLGLAKLIGDRKR